VKLDQTSSETKFVFGGLAPRWWARVLLGGLIAWLFWGGLTNEVRQFMETAPEFH
jgi:hypothetical protein